MPSVWSGSLNSSPLSAQAIWALTDAGDGSRSFLWWRDQGIPIKVSWTVLTGRSAPGKREWRLNWLVSEHVGTCWG